MMSSIAAEVASSIHLLQYTLSRSDPSTIIVCSSQDDFMATLLTEIESRNVPDSDILSNSLQVLAMSSHVSMVFVRDMVHLRAYLSSLSTKQSPANASPENRLLILHKTLDQMRESGSFHAQNLMRSCAIAVEAADAQRWRLILAETSLPEPNADSAIDQERFTDPWTQNIPMIAEATRLGAEASDWTGRMVQIRRVVGRWCKFGTLAGDL